MRLRLRTETGELADEPTSGENPPVAHADRLSALDATFLHLEDAGGSHMHVASVMIFVGRPPSVEELIDHVTSRLHLVPRYRQRLAFVPLGQGRPVWTDDPHFNPGYHIRHTALPRPGDEDALRRLAGRLFSQRLDRFRPLWEIWLVERLADDRFALVAKTHHALVDGISGVDITTVLFDTTPEPPVSEPPTAWVAGPLPGPAKLLADALVERATVPGEMSRGIRAVLRAPRRVAGEAREGLAAMGASALAGLSDPAPPSPFNVDIGPHRRYTWVDAEIADFKAIKDQLGGTLNDVVLTAVTLALGEYLRTQGHDTTDLVLRAMVPVSVRADGERGVLGNRVAAIWAPLPVDLVDPLACFDEVRLAMEDLKASGQAVGAQALTNLAGFAPPTILSQAARLQARQRYFNLVVTNVPGPQFPLYLLGRRMLRLYPVVPLARRQTLGVAVMSYDGHLGFGLLGDFDALPGLEVLALDLEAAIAKLARAGTPPRPRARPTRRRSSARSSASASSR